MKIQKSNINVRKMTVYERNKLVNKVKLLMQRIVSIQKNKPIILFCETNVYVENNMKISIDVSNILSETEKQIYKSLLAIIISELKANRKDEIKQCKQLAKVILKFEKTNNFTKMNLTPMKLYCLLYIQN